MTTLLHFTKPSYFSTVMNLFWKRNCPWFLACLLQVLCRRHRQYPHHLVSPLHRGNYFSSQYSFFFNLKLQRKKSSLRARLVVCRPILGESQVERTVAFASILSRYFSNPQLHLQRYFFLSVVCRHQVLFQHRRRHRHRHHLVYPHQPRLVYQQQLRQGIRESKFSIAMPWFNS